MNPAFSVIFLTGQASPASLIEGLSVGVSTYLPKSTDSDVLEDEVRRALI